MARPILLRKVCRSCFKTKKRDAFSPQIKGGIKRQSVCKTCANVLRKEWGKRWLRENPDKNTEIVRNYRRNLRKKVLEKFGNKCRYCGFNDIRALQIDHINGGGYKERKRLKHGGGHRFHLMVLADHGKKYQLLCANCNWIKKHENKEH